LCYDGAHANISNCTIAGNAANYGVGAVYCDDLHGPDSHPTVANSILWDNASPQISADAAVVMYSTVQGGWPGYGNIDADPLFIDANGPDNDPNTWEDNDYRLAAGSPCIDAGCNCAAPRDIADLDDDGDTTEYIPFDLDGEGRFFDDPATADTGSGPPPVIDMGAYEFGGTDPQPIRGDLDADGDVDMTDLNILLANYATPNGADGAQGDMNCDGSITLADLAAFLSAYAEAQP
jgi:hypothetical protein